MNPRLAMLNDLARSGLTEEDAKRLKMVAHTGKDSAKLGLSQQADGYLIPYFDFKGKPTKFFRYRLLEDLRSGFEKVAGKKVLKYSQPPKTLNEIYLAPLLGPGKYEWEAVRDNPERTVLITEGEKKAAAGCKAGLPVIGLGGVWNFMAQKAGMELLKDLEAFAWKGRDVYVVFDSDASANADVRKAANRLAERLKERGATVYVGFLPGPEGTKVGLDDYLLDHTLDDLKAFLTTLQPMEECTALHHMNELVTYVADPGLIYVNSSRQRIAPSAFVQHAFSQYSHTKVNETGAKPRPERVSTAAEWLKWPQRATVQKLVYEPGLPPLVEGCMNLWPGYAVDPVKGDVKPWKELLDFLFAGADPADRQWFERWCAYPFQHPGTKMRTAVLLWGKARGTGKSQVGFTLGELYGENYVMIGDQELENQNNDWAFNRQFVLGDEITGNNNRKLANALKTMITREQINVNIKYVPRFTIRDCINYVFTSNDADAFYLDAAERRYFIHEVKGTPMPTAFYDRYDAWRRSKEGKQALLHYLLTMDLGAFNPMAAAPDTAAKKTMVALTRTELEAYIEDAKTNPDDFLKRFGGGDLASLNEFVVGYDPGDGKRVSNILMARKLKQAGMEVIVPKGYTSHQIRLTNGNRVGLIAVKNASKWEKASAEELRAHYEKHRNIQGKRRAS